MVWQKRESEQKSCFICGWSSFLLDLIAAWLAARHNGVWIHCATWRRIMPSQFSWNVLRKNYASKYTSDVAKHNADTGTLTAFGHFVSNHWISAFCVRALCVDEPHSYVATELCRWTHYSYCYCPLKSYLLHTWFFSCKYESEGWYKNGIICQSNFYANGSRPSQASMCWLAHCTYTHTVHAVLA